MLTPNIASTRILLSLLLFLPVGAADAAFTLYYSPNPQIAPAVQSLLSVSSGSINCAANDLTDPRIVGSLCTASRAGATVTCCLALTGGTGSARNLAAAQLRSAGVLVYASTMSDTLGNHLLTVQGGTVAIGNYYWSPTAVQIGNWLAIVPDPVVTASYDAHFAALVSGGTLTSSHPSPARALLAPPCTCADCGNCSASPPVWFSPRGGCQAVLVTAIAAAKSSIRAQVYTATNPVIFRALSQARLRGVDVQVVADATMSRAKHAQICTLPHAGVIVYLDAAETIMHDKVLILDSNTVYTGSYNYSTLAEQANAENLIRLDDPAIVAAYVANWELHRSHSQRLASANAPPTPRSAFPRLHSPRPLRGLRLRR